MFCILYGTVNYKLEVVVEEDRSTQGKEISDFQLGASFNWLLGPITSMNFYARTLPGTLDTFVVSTPSNS